MGRERNVGLRPHRTGYPGAWKRAAGAPDTAGGNASVNELAEVNDHDVGKHHRFRVSAFVQIASVRRTASRSGGTSLESHR